MEYDLSKGVRGKFYGKDAELHISIKRKPNRGELARQLLGAGRHWLKPGDDPIKELIQEREQDHACDETDNPS